MKIAVSSINQGKRYRDENIKYPIRNFIRIVTPRNLYRLSSNRRSRVTIDT